MQRINPEISGRSGNTSITTSLQSDETLLEIPSGRGRIRAGRLPDSISEIHRIPERRIVPSINSKADQPPAISRHQGIPEKSINVRALGGRFVARVRNKCFNALQKADPIFARRTHVNIYWTLARPGSEYLTLISRWEYLRSLAFAAFVRQLVLSTEAR